MKPAHPGPLKSSRLSVTEASGREAEAPGVGAGAAGATLQLCRGRQAPARKGRLRPGVEPVRGTPLRGRALDAGALALCFNSFIF